jgi:predicted secreted protein
MSKNFAFNVWKSEVDALLIAARIDPDEIELDDIIAAFKKGYTPEQVVYEQQLINE